MGIHLEYVTARSASISYQDERDVYGAIAPEAQDVLVIAGDDGVVVTGTREELLAFAERIAKVVQDGPAPYEG